MQRWLRNYDHLRTNGGSNSSINEAWHSTKYDLENMSWDQIRDLYIPELDLTWGKSCEALRKSWFAYKMAGKQGEYRVDLALRINKIQNALGIKRTEFPGIDPVWVDEELSHEDIRLKQEEQNDEMETGAEELEDWEDL